MPAAVREGPHAVKLTSTPFFAVTVAVLLGTTALMVWAWNRIPGPPAGRYAARAGLTLLSQLCAVVMVLVYVNNNMGPFYDSWSDLFGSTASAQVIGGHSTSRSGGGTDTDGGRGGGGGSADATAATAADRIGSFHPYGSDVLHATVVGPRSGVRGNVYVWLPPQYRAAAYAHTRFPVVELLPGTPGLPQAWFRSMRVQKEMGTLMAQGKVAPMILVAADLNLLGTRDDGCADLPGSVQTATWLADDVPTLVRHTFRAAASPRQWGIMGYSAGAYCAVNLTVQHPDVFRSAVSLSGYDDPESSLVLRDAALARQNSPELVLRGSVPQPPVAMLLGGSLQDKGTVPDAERLLAALAPVNRAQSRLVEVAHGGHVPAVWRAMLPASLEWLTERFNAAS